MGHAAREKIVHLSTGHELDDARIYWKECLSLARAGFEVIYLVAARPGAKAPPSQPGVEVVPIPRREGRFGRIAISPFSILFAALRQKANIYHFHDPELLPVGVFLRAIGKRVIYDVHEDMPRDILTKSWIPNLIRGSASMGIGAVEWMAVRMLSGCVAATPVIRARFPDHRAALVQNYARAEEFASCLGQRKADPPVVAYVGGVTLQRCAVEMVDAIARLRQSDRARLVIAGPDEAGVADKLQSRAGWSRVDYLGRVDRNGVKSLLGRATVGLALFHPAQSYMEAQPVKLFEYMAAGIPVIASDFPRFRAIVEDHGIGLCVPSQDVDAIAEAIDRILANPDMAEDMGRRGHALMLQSYSWESEERALLELYERILA